jgi:hypothetical protein
MYKITITDDARASDGRTQFVGALPRELGWRAAAEFHNVKQPVEGSRQECTNTAN